MCACNNSLFVIPDADFLGAQHRSGLPRTLRNHYGRGHYVYVFLAGHHKYWDDNGIGAGGRRALTVYQLWWVFGFNDGDRYWFIDEYKHAAVYD